MASPGFWCLLASSQKGQHLICYPYEAGWSGEGATLNVVGYLAKRIDSTDSWIDLHDLRQTPRI